MRTAVKYFAVVLLAVAPLMAGALIVSIGNPADNPEALSKHALLVARTGACRSPEKTSLTATAEGVINGQRLSIPLKLIPLSTAGTFAITHEWPSAGTWAIKVVAKNPDYKDYATGALIRIDGNSVEWGSVKSVYHEPTDQEIAAMLDTHSGADRASLK